MPTRSLAPRRRNPSDAAKVRAVEEEILDCTANNLHTEAVAALAHFAFPRTSQWVRIIDAASILQDAYGSLPPGGDEIRREVYEEAMKAVRRKHGSEVANKLARAF